LEEASSLLSCSAAFFGIDLTNEKVAKLIDDWYAAAKHPHAFYSARSDQTALSLLLHKAGMTNWASLGYTGHVKGYGPYAIVTMDRAYVKNE
jgi:hypothetical protein